MRAAVFCCLDCFSDKYTNSEIDTSTGNVFKRVPHRKDDSGKQHFPYLQWTRIENTMGNTKIEAMERAPEVKTTSIYSY